MSLTQIHESPLTGSMQTQQLPGARWMTNITIEGVISEDDQAALQIFNLKMRGRAGRIAVPNLGYRRRGTGGGTVLVKGASQVGATLITDGWTAGSTMKVGDFFQIGTEMKMVVANATADGSGNMTIVFEPPLRSIPADNAAINYTTPTVVMMPIGDLASWTYEADDIMLFSFEFMEALT